MYNSQHFNESLSSCNISVAQTDQCNGMNVSWTTSSPNLLYLVRHFLTSTARFQESSYWKMEYLQNFVAYVHTFFLLQVLLFQTTCFLLGQTIQAVSVFSIRSPDAFANNKGLSLASK